MRALNLKGCDRGITVITLICKHKKRPSLGRVLTERKLNNWDGGERESPWATINSLRMRIAHQLTHRAPVRENIINFPLKCIIAQYFYGNVLIRVSYSRERVYKWEHIYWWREAG